MDNPSKANSRPRVRRSVLLFTLAGVLVLCASMHLDSKPDHPSIDISNVRYEGKTDLKTSCKHVNFDLTNTGAIPFSVIPLQGYMLRIETTDDRSLTEDHRVEKPFIRTTVSPYGESFLSPGGGVATWVDLPQNTKRWQIGFVVRVASARRNWETKLGSKWSKPILSAFGRWIPNEERWTEVWGPTIDIPGRLNAPKKELLHPPN
jgi:hypothetical protein